ncbi:MAG: acylneuraminate cytidylyltransferase family protein [Chloroflexi bacterium]|nr:acylneuraminate cytidylyltransferase family protein [Chloroflexota bacterium]
MTTIAALVPMRHNSQRVPGKNYRPLAGKPLYQHIIETLIAVPEVNSILVDTDSAPVMEGLRRDFPQVKLIERPEHLRAPEIPMNEILAYDTAKLEADFYLQTHSTNPLLKAETVSGAVGKFLAQYPAYDSMFSVTRLQTRLWDSLTRAINHNPAILLQTQDLPPIYEENSCFYLFTRQNLMQRRNRLGERPLMFEIPRNEAVDIDEEFDFQLADLMMRARLGATK